MGESEKRENWITQTVDAERANPARVYDYYLGGFHNFAVDREVAHQIDKIFPTGALNARVNRAFLRRTVRYCVRAGLTQFLDIGSGIPTAGNVHEVAQRANPRARVVYVDIDPVAVAHSRAILGDDERSAVVECDLRDPERILADPGLRRVLDLDQPVALLMVSMLHFVPDADDPVAVLARYRQRLVPGSHLVISHGSSDGVPPEWVGAPKDLYERAVAALTLRDRAGVEALFDGFDLVEPGLVWMPDWRPDSGDEPVEGIDRRYFHAGVGCMGAP